MPGIAEGNATVSTFVTEAIAKSSSNLRSGATSSGTTYSIVDGFRVRPFALAGPLDDLQLGSSHQDVGTPGTSDPLLGTVIT